MPDYMGEHEAPMFDSAGSTAPMHNISPLIPDFYERSHDYKLTHDSHEAQAMNLIHRFRGKRTGLVKVYRAVPKDTVVSRGKGIQPGNWVTPVRGYAMEHGRSHLSNQFKIVSKAVPPRHLYTEGNGWEEWGYDPSQG